MCVSALGVQVVLDYNDHGALASSPHMFTCDENDNTEAFDPQRFFVLTILLLFSVQPLCAVAGGDGTVGWVLNSIDELRNKARKASERSGLPCQNFTDPTLVLVPLGTGNDLARCDIKE